MAKKSRDFVSKYDNIRQILRDIFLYGCYSIEDFERKGISKSKFNQEKRKITGFLKPNIQRIGGKIAMYFSIDMFETSYNFLLDTFAMKSAVDSEIELFIQIMQILWESNNKMAENEIWDRLAEVAVEIDHTTLYRQLCKMTENGDICVNSNKKPFTYELCDNIFADLDDDELISLLNCVDFLKNVLYPSAIGSMLFKSLNEYLKSEGLSKAYTSPFIYKHSHPGQVLDDEILWELMHAIKDNFVVSFNYNNRNVSSVYPIKLIIDEGYGRRYLFGVLLQYNDKPNLFRLDKISTLKIEKQVDWDIDDFTDLYIKQTSHSFTGASLLYDKQPTVVELSFSTSIYEYVKRRFPSAVFLEDGKTIIAKLIVNDTTELKPWLRRFTGKISVLPSTVHKLDEEMKAELDEWRVLYETFQ